MIYLIGGPPRVGKTTLVNYLVQKHPMHAVSTDAIRYMLRRSVPKEALNPDIFMHFGQDPLTLWERDHEQTLIEQNRQSEALWPAIREFTHSYDEDGIDLIIEGVAILPEFVSGLDVPHKSVFLGNTGANHSMTIQRQAMQNEHDWMHGHSEADIEKAAEFFALFSSSLQTESVQYGLRYQEVEDDYFEDGLKAAANYLLEG